MKIKFLMSVLLAFPITSFSQPSDIFENSWFVDSVHLTTHAHELFQGYDHSLEYVTPDGRNSSTDMCALTAPNTLHCVTDDIVVVDIENHSVTLNNKVTYFENGYQPPGSPLSGHWHSDDSQFCETDIIIPYDHYAATRFYPASIYGSTGSESLMTFYLANDKYSHKFYFGKDPEFGNEGYALYDKNNQLIKGMQDVSKVVTLRNRPYSKECIYTKM